MTKNQAHTRTHTHTYLHTHKLTHGVGQNEASEAHANQDHHKGLGFAALKLRKTYALETVCQPYPAQVEY